ncbi:hypothetical protein [Sphingobium sp. WCS2017Hpa-17]|uniref:hypothetical protein n=1 Tax=Sphingobium sp. WCS2017Hpa-17 TaxID=3073638 RepID=UPI00288C2A1D|nr:hypothetical protein [Sphingobium sp. WCS2017Hpa-17]
MPDSLAHRLRTTPYLIAECEGCTVVEPLQFIPIAAAPSAGEGGRPAMVAGGSLANVSDHVHERASA